MMAGSSIVRSSRRGVRVALGYLAVNFVGIGLWATFATRGFYDNFPGGGLRWIAGDGPYNAHLTGDAGAGFLAVGVVLMMAAVWMRRQVVQAALAAVITHSVPHLAFHVLHPSGAAGNLDRTLIDGGIAFDVLIAAVAFVVITASPDPRGAAPA